MIEALGGALPGELVVLAPECRQFERLEMMREQKLGVSVMMPPPSAGRDTPWSTSSPPRPATRIDRHVEARRSSFDSAQHQVLHGIKANGAARDGVAHRGSHLIGADTSFIRRT